MSQQEFRKMYLLQDHSIIGICFIKNAAIREQNLKYTGLNSVRELLPALNPIEKKRTGADRGTPFYKTPPHDGIVTNLGQA
jgi:hypothetical protein